MIEKRTKIITTIGPSSEKKEITQKLFESGMTTIRLNFSHGNFEEHLKRIENAREISKETGIPISVMLDTKGPEIRVGKIKDGKQIFNLNQEVLIYTDKTSYENKESVSGELTVSYDFSKDIEIGKKVLVDDGKLILEVSKVESENHIVKAIAQNTHTVKTNKRINLPGTRFLMDFLSAKDIEDIKFGCKHKVDFIAASFVNDPEDVKQIRNILKEQNAEEIQIFSKIESQYAVDNFDQILEASDGIMVARGDLGLEIPYYEVPVVQKMIIRKSRNQGKPVIVATQMLDSMENSPAPTRAEVTDVYFAIELGADATMLSGESAAGNYPVEAVKVMSTINKRAEKEFYNKLYYPVQLEKISSISFGQRANIAKKVAKKAQDGEYRFAIVLSRTGQLLKEVAKFRPNTAILGVVKDEKQVTKFGITSSVFIFPDHESFNSIKDNPEKTSKEIIRRFGGRKNDKYLIVENERIQEFIFK